jgi:hypothetical protein
MPHNLNTDGQLRSLWMGDAKCGGSLTSHTPLHTVLIPHPLTVSVWGGGLGSGGWATTPPRHKLEGWPTVMEGEEWGWGEGDVRGQAPPSLMGSLYRSTEEVTAKLPPMWRRLISLHAFSYDAKFHCAPSPAAHSFIPCILLRCLISLSAFSYGT